MAGGTRSRLVLVGGLLAAVVAAPMFVPAASADPPTFSLTVRGLIDGRSAVHINMLGELWWHHFEFAAPGRHAGANEPTLINGVAWFPNWPAAGENRDCQCDSSKFDLKQVPFLPIALTSTLVPNTFTCGQCRGASQFQAPALVTVGPREIVVTLDDNPIGGSAFWQFTIESVVP